MNVQKRGSAAAVRTDVSDGANASRVAMYCDWPIGTRSWAELMALHLTLQLHDAPVAQLLPAISPMMAVNGLSEDGYASLMRAFATARDEGPRTMRESDGVTMSSVGLRLLGDGLDGMPQSLPLPARTNVGIVQTCDTRLDADAKRRGHTLDLLVAGSTWMRDLLLRAGMKHVVVYPPGIDTRVFTPGPKSGHLRQRFVIFSGGRLDYHKGQDIVIAAVRVFRERHPETLLLTTWQTPLPETIGSITRAGHTPVAPEYYGTTTDIGKWAAANGLPSKAIVDLGQLAPAALAVLLREADVALFPNRAECDANPLVLECMASGVPVIASRNTGQLDVATAERCYPLLQQTKVRGMVDDGGIEGWGESSVEEIVAQLEAVFAQTSAAQLKAAVAAEWARAFGWDLHAPRLIELLAPVISRVTRS